MTVDTATFTAIKWPAAFWAGLIVLAGIWLGPLPAQAQTAFSPNMIIHLGVVAVASPLLAWGLCNTSSAPVLRHPVGWILIFALLDMIIVVGWHVPMFHEMAARFWAIFAIEQISFLLVGLCMWYMAFREFGRRETLVTAAAFFLSFMHMSVLGMILLLAPHVLYDPDVCRGAFGFVPLDDQRLGGILMASWGSFTYLAGALWLLWRVLSTRTDALR